MISRPTNSMTAERRKARIAVVGTGWWGTTAHLPALAIHPDAEIVAVCDRRVDVLSRVTDKFGISTTYTDYIQMLNQEELDGAVVSVWSAAHFEVARACLARGLHILVEKPMVLRARHAKELVDLSQLQERELIVGYPDRKYVVQGKSVQAIFNV
jgi:predicted dehydrogenase